MYTLEALRKQIDNIDEQIITLFARRFSLVKKLGKIKKEKKLPIKNITREEEKINTLIKRVEGMSKEFIRDIWQRIFTESYRLEK
ncbi:MAG: chorismate mutase [Candidatus Levybacteria bacterium]|nr:chorismate mutase [Candidatus Levybacteria bacterium]